MMGKKWNVGDKVYRFAFNVKAECIEVDIFILKELNKTGGQGWFEHVEDPNGKKLFAGCIVSLEDLDGRVLTKGSTKYVVVRKDDVEEAAGKLRGYLKEQIDRHEKTLRGLNDLWRWIDEQV